MAADTATLTGAPTGTTTAPAPTPEPMPTPSPAPSPAPAPAPSPEPLAPTGAWHESLPEGLKGEKTLHAFKDPAALASSYLEMKKWQNGAIKLPGKDATPAEVAAFRTKLGVPASAAEYDLTALGTEMALDPGQKDAVLGAFHKFGLTQEQVGQILPWAFQRDQQQKAQLNEGYLTELDGLADEWGESVFNRRVNQVQSLVRKYFTEAAVKWLHDTKAVNHPELLKSFHPIAAQFEESGYIVSDATGGVTPGELDGKITTARTALLAMDKGSPEYTRAFAAYEDMLKLHAEVSATKK